MKTKVEPKLKFEVGEKVVITDYHYSITNDRDTWPDEDDFTITTITKVNDDGSVEVEGGYVYRQSYQTEFGFTEVHNYFRIKRRPSDGKYTKFDSKRYTSSGIGCHCEVSDVAWFSDVTYLLKFSKKFEDKIVEIQKQYDEEKIAQAERQKAHDEKEAKRRPHLDAFKDFMEPLEKEFYEKKCKAWKELICANCKHNFGGKCSKWKDENNSYQDIKTMEVSSCSAFEGR